MSLEEGAARAWVLAFILMAGVGIGALVGIGCLIGANTCPGSSRPTITATDGREIYVRAGCAGCHGTSGQGGRGPSLVSGRLATLSEDELVSRITNGKRLAGMPKFGVPPEDGGLRPPQIRAVAQYVITLRGGS